MAKRRTSEGKAAEAAKPAASRTEQVEQRQRLALVREALAKRNRGEKLAPKEIAALKRFEREELERVGGEFVRRVPKKTYLAWSGRQTKVLHDQARLYGAPLEGESIDLPVLVRWLHDWLAEHRHELAIVAKGEASKDTAGGRSELVREQVGQLQRRNRLLDLKLEEEAESLLPREAVHELLLQLATLLRGAGHRLYKQCGDKAGDILAQTISDFEDVLGQLADGSFGEDEPGDAGLAAA